MSDGELPPILDREVNELEHYLRQYAPATSHCFIVVRVYARLFFIAENTAHTVYNDLQNSLATLQTHHNARLMLDSEGRASKALPGVVIDHSITNPVCIQCSFVMFT